jgi:hypothetical protein
MQIRVGYERVFDYPQPLHGADGREELADLVGCRALPGGA